MLDPLFETIKCVNKICRLSVAATLQVSQEEVSKDMGADAEAKNSVLMSASSKHQCQLQHLGH
jgi:hypothetical protein